MSKPTGGPAFPTKLGHWTEEEGMTLRDYFAAKAMAADMATSHHSAKDVAKFAYEMADAMLAEKWREEE
jgi:hypothetical protein